MLRASKRREGTSISTWRARAISYPNRISRYLAGVLHLKRSSRQDPDAQDEPQVTVAAAVMTAAAVATAVTAAEVSRSLQAQSTNVVRQNGLIRPSDLNTITLEQGSEAHIGNDEEIDASRQEWPFNVSNTEVFVFGEIKFTRGKLNKCLQLILELISVIQTVNIKRRLGVPESIEHAQNVRANVHDLIETLLSFIDDPRDQMAVRNQLNNGNIFINSKRNYDLQCIRRNNLRGSTLPTVSDPPSVSLAKRVNRARLDEVESSGQCQPASPFFSVARFDRTKALLNAAERQEAITQSTADVDEAPEATREEASGHQRDVLFEDDRFYADLGTFNRQEMRRQKIKIRPDVGRSRDEMFSIFEPRPCLIPIPVNNSNNVPAETPTNHEHLQNDHVNGDSIPTENNWCYGERQKGVGEEEPRAAEPEPVRSHPKMGVVAKSVVAVTAAFNNVRSKQSHNNYDKVALDSDSDSTVYPEGHRCPDEAGPSGISYRETTAVYHSDNGKDTDEDGDKHYGNVAEASRRKVTSWLEDSKIEPDNLKNKPELAAKNVTPLKPVRSRSLSAKAPSVRRHKARALEKSLSTRGIVPPPLDEEKTRNAFRAKSSPPLPQRAAGFGRTFNVKSTRNKTSSKSKAMKAVQPIHGTSNEPGTSENTCRPVRATSPDSAKGSLPALPPKGVTRASLPPPPPPPRQPPPPPPRPPPPVRTTSPVKCGRCILRHEPRVCRHVPRGYRRLGSPPPPPRTAASTSDSTSTSTSTSASSSNGESTVGRQLAAQPAALRNSNGVPDQQNITQPGDGRIEWLWMDDNIMLQHGTIPFPTTYKPPE